MMKQESIVDTISCAVAMMEAAKYRETIELLRVSLAKLLAFASSNDASQLVKSEEEFCVTAVSLKLTGEECMNKDNAFFGVDSFDTFAIYDKALQFEAGTTDEVFYSEFDNVHRASSLVLYNTALVHHLVGLQGPNQQKHLRKALKLYEMAIDVLHNCKNHNDADKFITLAVFNNKGHIYCQFSELDQVKLCVEWLKSVLQCCEPVDELIHFRLTALLWNGELNYPAAPAA